MEGKRCGEPRGKALGGTSVLNAVVYARGKRSDFDKMALDGNIGWDYKTVLKYYKRSENNLINGDPEYHGFGGPLDVNIPSEESPQARLLIDANKELGIKEIDYNGANQLGVSRVQSNIRNGRRLSAFRAFLEPVQNRTNLKLLTKSFVTKIDPLKPKGIVTFSRNGRTYQAFAKKEIILSAGSINTPQILMLSGIGPRDHLRQMNIPLIRDLPVGNNLRDHPTFFGTIFDTNNTFVDKGVREFVKEYLKGKGFYTIAGNLQVIGFYKTRNNLEKPSSGPNIELLQVPSPSASNYTKISLGLSQETFDAVFANVNGSNAFLLHTVVLHPESHGTVRLKSKNPYEYPLIDKRFFSDPKGVDIESIYNTLDFINRLENTTAFKKMNAKRRRINLPACAGFRYDTKSYWLCLIRQLSFSIYHPVGTAKMGPSIVSGAVVDARFKVHGFKSLRVVDASVLPFSFGGHPSATCMMLGERAYDFIRQDY